MQKLLKKNILESKLAVKSINTMFDLKKLELHRKKSKNTIQNSPFYQFIHNDIIDRLKPIDKAFNEILIISPVIENMLKLPLKAKFPHHNLTIAEVHTDCPANKFDLIIFPMGLHWISDIQDFLYKLRTSLQKNGILICNFPGGGSLKQLRYKLVELESANNRAHVPHISPFIQFKQITFLLQQAGFAENIIDMEPLKLEYDSPLALMKALQSVGESNALECGTSYSITKKMYKTLAQQNDTMFQDQINLITFVSSPAKSSIQLKSEHFHG